MAMNAPPLIRGPASSAHSVPHSQRFRQLDDSREREDKGPGQAPTRSGEFDLAATASRTGADASAADVGNHDA
jgi:hypothetical protein